MRELTLEQCKLAYPLLSREIQSVAQGQAKYVMMKNNENKQEYFKIICILTSEFGGIYSSFEKKFEKWFQINKETREVSAPEINTIGFISERSIKKLAGHVYIKMFYSKTESDALIEFDRLNK